MTWRLFFLSSTRNKNTGQVLIFRSGGDSPRGWKTARWLRRVTKGEKTLLRSWMNHIPSDVSGSRFAKTWHHFRGCPELSDLAAAEMDGVFFSFFLGVPGIQWWMKGFPVPNRTKLSNSIFNCESLEFEQHSKTQLAFEILFGWYIFFRPIWRGRHVSKATTCLQTPQVNAEPLAAKEVAEKRAIATFDSINVIEFRNQWLHGWLERNSSHLKKWAHQFLSLGLRLSCMFFFVMWRWRWSLLFLEGWCFGVADADRLKFELFLSLIRFNFSVWRGRTLGDFTSNAEWTGYTERGACRWRV